MDESDIRRAVRAARKGIAQYLWLMRALHEVDVRTDREFQRRYNAFYRVRQRSPEWYAIYYDSLETHKKAGADFAGVLDTLWQRLHRFEPSFSSKLVATIDPTKPVWDRFVLMNTCLRAPSYTDPQRKLKAKVVYRQISDWYAKNLATTIGRRVVEVFAEEILEHGQITDLKKFDFVLWQTRPSANFAS